MDKIILQGHDSTEIISVETGLVTRVRNGQVYHNGSNQWIIQGFTLVNNFGRQIGYLNREEFYSALKNNPDSLFYGNGKAKFRVSDIDHGTRRTWGAIYRRYQVSIVR